MRSFPSYAKLILKGFSKERESALLRTEMESGPAKQAKVKSRVMVPRDLTYALDSKTDYQNFITWFQTTISYGALWFDWIDPEDGVTKPARIVSKLGKEEPMNGALTLWQVSFKLETWST